MAARDRETVTPEVENPGRSAASRLRYEPCPGTRPWSRRPAEQSQAPLPPPCPAAVSTLAALTSPRLRPAGRRGGGAASGSAGLGLCERQGAGRGAAGPGSGRGPLGFRTQQSRRAALTLPVERGRVDGGTVPNSSQKPVAGVRVETYNNKR